jgi:hypothetical protein
MRKLASIQVISEIRDIPGADKIKVCNLRGLGWECVIKANEFNTEDKIIYVECDSIMPEKPEFEFLRDRKFRVKTIKLRKQTSQGLVLPLSMLPNGNYNEGDDVTELMGIKKYDPQSIEEQSMVASSKSNSKTLKFLMQFSAFRYIYLKLNRKEKGSFPSGVSKTDEENIQNCVNIISNNFDKSFYISEKLEGQSTTFFTSFEKSWILKNKIFGVCSRNMWLKTPDKSKYWESAKKYNIKEVLMSIPERVSIQVEQIGVGIQGNIYKLEDVQIRVFNVYVNGERMKLADMKAFCNKYNLPMVPIIDEDFVPSKHILVNDRATIVKWLLDYSNGMSTLYKTKREGIVIRLNDNTNISVKARSPEYLLEHGE